MQHNKEAWPSAIGMAHSGDAAQESGAAASDRRWIHSPTPNPEGTSMRHLPAQPSPAVQPLTGFLHDQSFHEQPEPSRCNHSEPQPVSSHGAEKQNHWGGSSHSCSSPTGTAAACKHQAPVHDNRLCTGHAAACLPASAHHADRRSYHDHCNRHEPPEQQQQGQSQILNAEQSGTHCQATHHTAEAISQHSDSCPQQQGNPDDRSDPQPQPGEDGTAHARGPDLANRAQDSPCGPQMFLSAAPPDDGQTDCEQAFPEGQGGCSAVAMLQQEVLDLRMQVGHINCNQ